MPCLANCPGIAGEAGVSGLFFGGFGGHAEDVPRVGPVNGLSTPTDSHDNKPLPEETDVDPTNLPNLPINLPLRDAHPLLHLYPLILQTKPRVTQQTNPLKQPYPPRHAL